jgi:prepilin-type N-terminal cleavage/methylation domain-containing protein
MAWTTAAPRDEGGFSLVETLVAMSVLAIILPTLFVLMLTEVTSSRNQRTSSANNQALLFIAETIKAAPYNSGCYTATLPAGSLGSAPAPICSVPVTPLLAAGYSVQQVTIQVFAGPGDTGQSKTLVVVKSARSS